EAQDHLAKKKVPKEVQENYVFLESEIKSPRDVAGGGNSTIGNLKIAEFDPRGHFVKILNCAPEKEERIGDYLLKQDVQGQIVAVFQFPPETTMGPKSTMTVSVNKRRQSPRSSPSSMWVNADLCEPSYKKAGDASWWEPRIARVNAVFWFRAADATVLQKPPSDFLWEDLERFRTSLDCATILCEPSGQAVAWYTPLYWNRRQGSVVEEETEKIENIVIPTFSTTKQKQGWENE
ncbi:PREDICTED: lamin tail domain-containing protein 1, partial [Cariama cristata]|uniref:lamin tail domain-containing protein 1 n=1 Tax=Cariama cristata TaxID=54380 RepID=UPI0005204826